MSTTAVNRREALGGAAKVGLGLPLLAACAAAGNSNPTTDPNGAPSSRRTATQDRASGAGLVSISEVPVGSGVVIAESEVVITQPTQGDFKAFTAICTHQGCTVNEVSDTINCPCHLSKFSIEDGSNVLGPGGSPTGSVGPLSPIEIRVDGDQISLA